MGLKIDHTVYFESVHTEVSNSPTNAFFLSRVDPRSLLHIQDNFSRRPGLRKKDRSKPFLYRRVQ